MADGGFTATGCGRLEERVLRYVCQPLLARIPRSVRPNAISLTTHFAAWVTNLLACVSVYLSPLGRTLALCGAGLGTFVGVVGDCLDGMQARKTGQCSKLGEMMDHWLDAINVPLVTLGMTAALQLDPWLTAAVHVTNAMIYNAQLILYHHSGKFVHPNTTGVDAQVGIAVGYVTLAIALLLVDPLSRNVHLTFTVVGCVAIATQLRLNFFYYARLRGLVLYHLPFVLLGGALSGLYVGGALDRYGFSLAVVFLSFRITGSYVQATILKRRYAGFDAGMLFWLAAIAAGRWLLPPLTLAFGVTLQGLLPYLACAYLAGRTLGSFALRFGEITAPPPPR